MIPYKMLQCFTLLKNHQVRFYLLYISAPCVCAGVDMSGAPQGQSNTSGDGTHLHKARSTLTPVCSTKVCNFSGFLLGTSPVGCSHAKSSRGQTGRKWERGQGWWSHCCPLVLHGTICVVCEHVRGAGRPCGALLLSVFFAVLLRLFPFPICPSLDNNRFSLPLLGFNACLNEEHFTLMFNILCCVFMEFPGLLLLVHSYKGWPYCSFQRV